MIISLGPISLPSDCTALLLSGSRSRHVWTDVQAGKRVGKFWERAEMLNETAETTTATTTNVLSQCVLFLNEIKCQVEEETEYATD